ncbi:hypothetical protein BVG97_24025 [Serratia marcescens]|nr:hypothetical protein BVG97_24025 [Serratia marcescens]ASM04020.1 hypothetical protein BVG88_18455 [Serratia marcescens]
MIYRSLFFINFPKTVARVRLYFWGCVSNKFFQMQRLKLFEVQHEVMINIITIGLKWIKKSMTLHWISLKNG